MAERMGGSELIISPENGTLYHIALKRDDGIPKKILLVGDPDRAEIVTSFFDDGIKGQARHREFVTLWGTYKGEPVAVMGTGIGVDNTEIASVELHAVDEYDYRTQQWDEQPVPRTLIRVGTSASPQQDVKNGSLAISKHAIGLDNTGLSYLHHPSLDDYPDPEAVYYTPEDPQAKAIFKATRDLIWTPTKGLIRPYISTASPDVTEALESAARAMGLPEGSGENGFHTGITTSAPGFFAPQGRRIGRLSNIAIPDLQERLASISVAGERAVNNEMEASFMFRINREILGHKAGAVCVVIANRAEGEFITPEVFMAGVRRGIQVALDAIVTLDKN